MNSLALPIIVPFLTAVVTLLAGRGFLQRVLAGVSVVFQLGVALLLFCRIDQTSDWLVLKMGNWSAPYGIILSADYLSATLLILATSMVLGAVFYHFFQTEVDEDSPYWLPLMQFLMAGMAMSFLTGDIFNLFVAFEVMLMASYALMTLESSKEGVKQAFPYLTLNLVGGTVFLLAAALCYGVFGTLNFAEISLKASQMSGDPKLTFVAVMLTLVFGFKAGMFPFYYWLPNSYPHLPTPTGALYAGMLTKVGVFAIYRLFATLMPHDLHVIHDLVLWLSAPTMILAVMGALSRKSVREILSWHILSQVGFMLLALGLFSAYSLMACAFYIVHHIVVKASLFLVGGIAEKINHTDRLKKMGGLWKVAPFVGVLFLFQALSLAGIPPLSGFWGKYMIVVDGIKQGQWVFVLASIVASIMTLMSMVKIWLAAFWKEDAEFLDVKAKGLAGMKLVVTGFVIVSLCIGLGANRFVGWAEKTSTMAMNQKHYQEVILKSK